MDGWRQNIRLRLCNVIYSATDISTTFLQKIVQPRQKKQNSGSSKVYKKTVETLLNELFTFDNQVANETKMEEYADEIGVKISV